jgi:hypothetical protein
MLYIYPCDCIEITNVKMNFSFCVQYARTYEKHARNWKEASSLRLIMHEEAIVQKN